MKTGTNNNHEFELSKYMLKVLLPYLRRLDEEQMAEKEMEAKIQGIFPPRVLLFAIHFFMVLTLITPYAFIDVKCFSHYRALTF